MANVIKNAKGCISISEINGKLVYAAIGTGYHGLNLNDSELHTLYNAYKTDPNTAENVLNEIIAARSNDNNEGKTPSEVANAMVKQALAKMLNFFTEFNFTPSYRFVNTLCNLCKNSTTEATTYVMNYFKLMDSPYASEICDKMKSPEFRGIITKIAENVTPTKTINSRLKIYYGAQGTGKTTEAMKHTTLAPIGCHSAMQPCDLIEDFDFDDGKPGFHPSLLTTAMENGDTVVLDEMNLLPFDSLRFLQTICDGKESLNWKGHTINIKEGFNVIGTMNLVVNGTTFGLPEPIVDRCSELKEFTLTADALMGAI